MDNNEYINGQQPAAPPPQLQRQYVPPPSHALPPDVAERRLFKGRVEYMSAGLLIYAAIMYAIVIGDIVLHGIFYAVTSSSTEEYYRRYDEFSDAFTESAGSMIAAVIVGVLFLMLFFIKALPVKEIFKPHRKMTFLKLLLIIVVLMGVQLPFIIVDPIVEAIFNLFGLSIQQAIESASAGSTTVTMFLYASFIGPIVEEIVYRGFAMHGLQRAGCGKVAAMLLSSVLFGIMHANPTQSVFAFFVGLVFAYAAIEYGLGWSIVLHITNNFIFGDLLVLLEKPLPDNVSTIMEYALFGLLFIGALIILVCESKCIVKYIKDNRSPAKHYGWTFTCIAYVVFIVIHIGLTLLQVQALE